MRGISVELLNGVITTLKQLDVRGYDSMNRLVSLVLLFEEILNTPTNQANGDQAEEGTKPEIVELRKED